MDNISELAEVFKTAADIGRSLVSLGRVAESRGAEGDYANSLNNAIAEMNVAILDAQSVAIEAQAGQMRQSQRIRELEQEIADLSDWDAEKARYKLVQIRDTVAAYAYLLSQEAAHEGEPLHYICTQCYQDRIKSIIQYDRRASRHICPRCQTPFSIHNSVANRHGVVG